MENEIHQYSEVFTLLSPFQINSGLAPHQCCSPVFINLVRNGYSSSPVGPAPNNQPDTAARDLTTTQNGVHSATGQDPPHRPPIFCFLGNCILCAIYPENP